MSTNKSMHQNTEPVFNNRPSRRVYDSRNVAVMIVPVFLFEGFPRVPAGKRSSRVSDSGLWSLPCGYMDWDESGHEAAIREAWEEVGLDLRGKVSEQPWHVQSAPGDDARQNIVLQFGCISIVDELPDLRPDGVEVTSACWLKIWDLNPLTTAFRHAAIAADYWAYLLDHEIGDRVKISGQ